MIAERLAETRLYFVSWCLYSDVQTCVATWANELSNYLQTTFVQQHLVELHHCGQNLVSKEISYRMQRMDCRIGAPLQTGGELLSRVISIFLFDLEWSYVILTALVCKTHLSIATQVSFLVSMCLAKTVPRLDIQIDKHELKRVIPKHFSEFSHLLMSLRSKCGTRGLNRGVGAVMSSYW
jgi:hypothetical protein